MRQSRDEITQDLAERWCWEVARRLYHKHVVEGVYRLDEGALLDDCFHCLDQVGVMAWLAEVDGVAIQREMVPCGHYVWRDGLKSLCGMERSHALPAWLFSDEALMPWVGVNAQQVRDGVCHRGATTRQGERHPGPIGPDTLAKHMVKLHVRHLEAVCNGAMCALAKAGVLGAKVTGLADGTELETTARSRGGGQVTRKVRMEDKRRQGHEIDVTVYGWKVLILLDAATQMPRAVKVVKIHAHEALWTRALVTQARANLAGMATRNDELSQELLAGGCDGGMVAQKQRLLGGLGRLILGVGGYQGMRQAFSIGMQSCGWSVMREDEPCQGEKRHAQDEKAGDHPPQMRR